MWWNDIKEMKHWMNRLTDRLCCIDENLIQLCRKGGMLDEIERKITPLKPILDEHTTEIKDCIIDLLDSEDEFNTINRLHDKLSVLLRDEEREQKVELATQTLDKFDEYMKNVDKLNSMINEFKGCVATARGALAERKQVADKECEAVVISDLIKEIHKSMLAFINAGEKIKYETHFKIDYIYNNIDKIAEFMQNCEKKSRKTRKSVKKKRAVSRAPLSE